MAPHSMVLSMVGTGLLWVGWYGFNAGSALAPDGIAANAFTTTTLATAVASFTWALLEYVLRGKPSVLGFCSGAVAGLVVITPACGYVGPSGAVTIGIAAGIVPFFACTKLKSWLGYDDALDTFGIHGVGGVVGALGTGVVYSASLGGPSADGWSMAAQLWTQVQTVGGTILLSAVGTTIAIYVAKLVTGLRVTPDVEREGLDLGEHGERAYNH